MKKSQSYWENRKAMELYEQLVDAEEAAEELRRIYMAASGEVEKKAKKLVTRFRLKHNLTEAEAERLLKAVSDPDNTRKLLARLAQDPKNADLVAELEAAAYASRLRRLSNLQKEIDHLAEEIFRKADTTMTAVLEKIGLGAYYRQIFGMQLRADAAFPFIMADPARVQKALNTRWSGRNFSERLWDNTEALARSVKDQLLLGILTGKTQKQMADEINEQFSKGSNATRRLVRTEANYVANQMQLEAYREHGVDKYIYVAILDLRTSPICRSLDKKVFAIAEAAPGVNYPPMHPWCRSTTIAWMPPQLLKKLQQAAVDPETGETIHIPGNMTYNEWYEKYVTGKPLRPGGF